MSLTMFLQVIRSHTYVRVFHVFAKYECLRFLAVPCTGRRAFRNVSVFVPQPKDFRRTREVVNTTKLRRISLVCAQVRGIERMDKHEHSRRWICGKSGRRCHHISRRGRGKQSIPLPRAFIVVPVFLSGWSNGF